MSQPPTAPRDAARTALADDSQRPVAAGKKSHSPSPRGHVALGALLVDRALITTEQLEAAIREQKATGRRLGRVLIDRGLLPPEALLEVLSEQLGVPTVRINAYSVNAEAIAALPEKVARRHTAFPLQRMGGTLLVALPMPKDLAALDDLRFASGCEIQTVLALEDEIIAAINRFYRDEWLPDLEPVDADAVVLDSSGPEFLPRNEAAERSAVAVLERVIARAHADRASDIHFEPRLQEFHVRFRIDGTFRDIAVLPTAVAPAIVARIKVLSAMDIAEHRVPQDGRFSATVGESRLDLRSSTYPTVHGEKAVLRILDPSRIRTTLESIGIAGTTLPRLRELIHRPEGIILITGPTGSGKTSTLYAALGEIVQTGKNIITIEDPVEYSLPGVNQGQTNHKAGFTFGRGLRAMLRQDPDVIMVGEIRDRETLDVSIEASLTGHLVLSTLHTNSAVATITRLMEMGLEPYLLASSVIGIVAQRLVRRICRTCRHEVPTPPSLRAMFRGGEPGSSFRGQGCHDCRGTGFDGRVGIFEVLRMNDQLAELVLARAPEVRVHEAARTDGMMSLREECLAAAKRGDTTLEEVLRVTHDWRAAAPIVHDTRSGERPA